MKRNPNVKIGDKVILTKARNGQTCSKGEVLEVIRERGATNSIVVKSKTGNQYSLFYNSPADQFELADRDAQIRNLKEEIKEMKVSLKERETELAFMEKYETKEDYVAEKLDKILTAHAENKTSSKRTSAIAEILKQLKQTDLI